MFWCMYQYFVNVLSVVRERERERERTKRVSITAITIMNAEDANF